MPIGRIPSHYNIHTCVNDQIGQVYVFLDPRSALAFARADRRMQSIFQRELPNLIKIQFGAPFPPSMPSEEQFLRLALTKTPHANALCEQTVQEPLGIGVTHADGLKALLAHWNDTLQLWDLNTGVYLKTLKGHEAQVTCMVISEDGTTALSGSMDNTLKLWDLKKGECIRTLQGHTGWVNCVHMNRDKTRAVSGALIFDNTLKVWNLETGECIKTMQGHKDGITHIKLSEDGTQVFSAAPDATMKFWNIETGECTKILQGHTGLITTLEINPNWTQALSGSRDKTLKLWDLQTGECVRTLEDHAGWIPCMQINQQWKTLLSGSTDNTLKLWDLQTGECIRTLHGHTRAVTCMKMSEDGTKALSGSLDHTIKIWDLQTGECIRTLLGHRQGINSVQINTGWTKAISASQATLKVWNLTPLPEECVYHVQLALLHRYPHAQEKFRQLPSFVRQAILGTNASAHAAEETTEDEDRIFDTLHPHILNKNFNRYIAREFLPPIARLFQETVVKRPNGRAYEYPDRAASAHHAMLGIGGEKFLKSIATSKIAHDSAGRRFAQLPYVVKHVVFQALSERKGLTEDTGQLAFHDKDGYFSTPQEKADAIYKVAKNR